MNRATEQALHTLLPRLNTDLPPQLISVSSSLLAQSRLKASNLNQDEEIARLYACCHLACERLKSTFNLPKIEPKPPLPPRIYNKLYKHLDTILVAQPRQRSPKKPIPTRVSIQPLPQPPSKTPIRRPQNPTTVSVSGTALRSRQTPTAATALAPYRTTTKGRKSELSHGGRGLEIPAWIHPTIRTLCASLQAPGAAPHVLAGVSSVLTLPTPRPAVEGTQRDNGGIGGSKSMIPALLAAVFILARTRLLGVETSGKEYVALRRQIIAALKVLRQDKGLIENVKGIEKGKKGWEGYEEVGGKDVDRWLIELSARGWVELDWFSNIQAGRGVDLPAHIDYDNTGLGQEGEDDGEQAEGEEEMMGIGMMVQDRVDYLSSRRREEFSVWKESVMRRLAQIEKANTSREDRMEID